MSFFPLFADFVSRVSYWINV